MTCIFLGHGGVRLSSHPDRDSQPALRLCSELNQLFRQTSMLSVTRMGRAWTRGDGRDGPSISKLALQWGHRIVHGASSSLSGSPPLLALQSIVAAEAGPCWPAAPAC